MNLQERAQFAYLDHLQAEAEGLRTDTIKACQTILEEPQPEITFTTVDVTKGEVAFELEGYNFKLSVRTKVHDPGGNGGNQHINGLYDERVLHLTLHHGSAYHPIATLADLGKVLSRPAPPSRPKYAPTNYGLARPESD